MVDTKPIYLSKTIMAATAVIIAGAFLALSGLSVSEGEIIAFLGVVFYILRIVTKDKVVITPQD